MRLLNVNGDGRFTLTTFIGKQIPSYGILSHTWEKNDQEVTFQDLQKGEGSSKPGYRKIRFCGDQAHKDGLKYFWIDSCCIDKSNSTELHEAINSMFHWYQNAAKCYVYLSDVSAVKSTQLQWQSAFVRSRWFTRGWTLQELLAPRSVEFFSRDGERAQQIKNHWNIKYTRPLGSQFKLFKECLCLNFQLMNECPGRRNEKQQLRRIKSIVY